MSCNSNSFLDDLKSKLENVDFPEIDTSAVDEALGKIDSAIDEATGALNDALGDLEGMLNKAIDEANKSLQGMLGDLSSALTPDALIEKIDEIKKEFGEAMDAEELDAYISKVTGGLSDIVNEVAEGIDGAKDKLAKAFIKGLDFESPCDAVPNIQKTSDGKVVEQPKKPVTPVEKPPEPAPPKNKAVIVPVSDGVAAEPIPQFVDTLDVESVKSYIKQNEGLRLTPYIDTLGYPTIGYGHLIEQGEDWMANGITLMQADAIFEKDWEEHYSAAQKIPGYREAPDSVKKVLIDMTFNLGKYWYYDWPGTTSALKRKDYVTAAAEMKDSLWYTQVGNRAVTNVNIVKSAVVTSTSTTTTTVTGGEETVKTSQTVKDEVLVSPSELIRYSYIAAKDSFRNVKTTRLRAISKKYLRKRPATLTQEEKEMKMLERAQQELLFSRYHEYIKQKYGSKLEEDHWNQMNLYSKEQRYALYESEVGFKTTEELIQADLEKLHEEHLIAFDDTRWKIDGVEFSKGV